MAASRLTGRTGRNQRAGRLGVQQRSVDHLGAGPGEGLAAAHGLGRVVVAEDAAVGAGGQHDPDLASRGDRRLDPR
jgi:hypothetical protein